MCQMDATVNKAARECQASLDELKALLEGKASAPISDQQMEESLNSLLDLFGMKADKRPAEKY